MCACTVRTTNIGRTVLVISISQSTTADLFAIIVELMASLAEQCQTNSQHQMHLMAAAPSLSKQYVQTCLSVPWGFHCLMISRSLNVP